MAVTVKAVKNKTDRIHGCMTNEAGRKWFLREEWLLECNFLACDSSQGKCWTVPYCQPSTAFLYVHPTAVGG